MFNITERNRKKKIKEMIISCRRLFVYASPLLPSLFGHSSRSHVRKHPQECHSAVSLPATPRPCPASHERVWHAAAAAAAAGPMRNHVNFESVKLFIFNQTPGCGVSAGPHSLTGAMGLGERQRETEGRLGLFSLIRQTQKTVQMHQEVA